MPLDVGDQPIAQDAVADEDESDLRVGVQDPRRGREDVVVPLAFEEPGDRAEGHLVVGQAQLAADLVARARGFRKASASIPL